MFKKIRSAFDQWRGLGGLNALRLFFIYMRRNGLVPALVQVHKRLFWDHGSRYLSIYERWYRRFGLLAPATPAVDVFRAPSLLIVGALDLPQCKKYRVLQKQELLHQRGVGCRLAYYKDVHRVLDQLQLATQLLFYRVPDCKEVRGYLHEAERLGIAVGYDIDDPIFDREVYQQNPNLDFISPDERKHLLDSSASYLQVIQQMAYVVVSTAGMERVVRRHFRGDVMRWPNVLDGETQSIVACLDDSEPFAGGDGGDAVWVSYMSGSRAHEQDFRVVAEALAATMQRYPQLSLMLGGYLELPECLAVYHERIVRFPFVGYHGYFSQLRQADINLVPLVDNTFNECKSTIRYLEASAVGVVTIASAVGDFNTQIENGVTGLLAASGEDWARCLAELIDNPGRRAAMAAAARAYVVSECTVASLGSVLDPQIRQLLARRACP